MIVLGIETSSRWSGAALVGPKGSIGAFHLREGGRTEHLHVLMIRLLDAAGIAVDAIGGLAVSLGPGSFTGLRIGIGAAKGFSLATGRPVVGVRLTRALAEAAEPWDGETAVWVDAGRGEVYGALFRSGEETGPGETSAPAAQIARLSDGPVCFVGTGALRHRSFVEERLGSRARFLEEARSYPDARRIAELGAVRLLAGESDPIDSLEPLYVRGADARLGGAGAS
jgi:tRNA threonylcarbamoyladenosine biosynthesis protein TsaB